MLIDGKGKILTDAEWKKMSVIEVSVNINDTNKLMRHFDNLVESFENTDECLKVNQKYTRYIEELESCVSSDKKALLRNLDDCITEMLILYEEHFYKSGYNDGSKRRNIIKNVFSKLIIKKK